MIKIPFYLFYYQSQIIFNQKLKPPNGGFGFINYLIP